MEEKLLKIIEDTDHWHGKLPPFSPNEAEVVIYKQLIGDLFPVCLLGMTEKLVPLCDVAVDLNPVSINKITIKCNWNDLKDHYAVIIGDGVINLEGMQFVENMSKLCDRFISRVFLNKLEGMKYATFFPNEFPGSKEVIHTQENIAIVIWEFK